MRAKQLRAPPARLGQTVPHAGRRPDVVSGRRGDPEAEAVRLLLDRANPPRILADASQPAFRHLLRVEPLLMVEDMVTELMSDHDSQLIVRTYELQHAGGDD